MKFRFKELLEIPRLGWCAVSKKGSKEINVYNGKDVEIRENFFVEGAWDGKFELGNFDKANFLMGSGAIIRKECSQVVFTTPSHTFERLHVITVDDKQYISNSLPLILYLSHSELELDYLKYEMDLNSILNGLKKYKRSIPLKNGRELLLFYYCNIILDEHNNILETNKPYVFEFENFKDYESRLIHTLKKLTSNAKSPDRQKKYGLVTTISKGYDATACAAIAKEVGCNTAVTFDKPETYAKDSGVEIAEKLNYETIVTKNANQYLQNDSYIEAEFVSSGELGTGIIFSAFENEFKDNLVFMGLRGGRIWGKNEKGYNNDLRFSNEVFTSTSLGENRIRAGYIIIHMALFGATQWESIHDISNSKEMKNYSIGGDYDRPIPRRIIEERGVPRSMFGMSKKGAGFNYRYDNLSRIKKRMSPASFKSFKMFYSDNRRKGSHVIKHWINYLWDSKDQYMAYILNKIGINYRVKGKKENSVSNPGAPSYLFNWGIYKTIKKYKKANIKENS